ncbi:MAG: DNA topoisomerase 3 [Bacteroidota bacterium]|nr:DNA topoisomerase 3 [Bacteroidota bacterium]
MKIIITEKPSVAREIAEVLNISNKHDGYLSNQEYTITWAYGHLLELCPPEVYGWKEWTRENLPMLPKQFKIQPAQRWDTAKKQFVKDIGIQKQLSIIDDLFSKCSEIIVATDAGREGELIFRLIYQHLHCRKPFKRLWVSSLTKKAIEQGFKELKNGSAYDNLYESARCRSEADWLVGMNASRALTIGAAFLSRFSLGRVQTPTLAILCKRFNENKNFVTEPFYCFRITLEKQGQKFTANSENYTNKDKAVTAFSIVQKAEKATVTSIEKKDKTENPPLLYDLTTLQRDANKYYEFSADDTLNLAQSLYEKKLITYPRTGSSYISEDIFEKIPELLEVAENDLTFGSLAADLKNKTLNKRSVNGEKVTDHHALLITENYADNLGEKENKIYQLILCRMIEAFSAPCVKAVTTIKLDCSGEQFKVFGNTIKDGNWAWRSVKKVFKNMEVENGEREEETQIFSELIPHETIQKTSAELLSKMTQPKPLHTEGSLLLAMETCGKDIEEETAKEALKECGIGTPSTRASIIETLIKRNYIERQKKHLIPTPKGLAVYSLLKDKTIASPELTGIWENRLEQISRGKQDHELFMKDIFDYTKLITEDVLAIGGSLKSANLSETNIAGIKCPKCKKGVLRKAEKNYYCINYPKKNADGSADKDGCTFTIWTTIAGKKITENTVRQIAEKRKSTLVKGFKSKAGKDFSAFLILKEDLQIGFEFEKKLHKA